MMTHSQPRLLATILASSVFLVSLEAAAGIIIDDFDDPLQILLPEMENQSVITPGVGVLNAERSISVSSSQTDPIGQVDVNITHLSHLTARIDGQFLNNPLNTPSLSFSARYDFPQPTDLTEGGVNDAVFIDMAVFQGSGISSRRTLSAGVVDANGRMRGVISGFDPFSDSPFTLALPFSTFGTREGGVAAADFTAIESLRLSVGLLSGSRDPNTNWFVQIDRIRVGSSIVIPEPTIRPLGILVASIVAINTLSMRTPGR